MIDLSGRKIMEYCTDQLKAHWPIGDYAEEYLHMTSVWSEPESQRIFVALSSGIIGVYDKKRSQPLVCFRAAPPTSPPSFLPPHHPEPDRSHPIDRIFWDGSQLFLGGIRKVWALDFL